MGVFLESLIKYLLKKKIIKLCKIENSFFLYKVLDKKITLSKDIIRLNYLKESPFIEEENNIISILFKKYLFLWFYKGKEERYLPEALLVYRKLCKKYSTILCVIEGEIDKIVLIKDGLLVLSFSKRNINKHDIFLLKDEYGVEKLLTLSIDKYSEFLEKSYQHITFQDLLNILNIQIDFKSLLTRMTIFVSFPLLISSIIVVTIMGIYMYLLQKEENRLHEEFIKNKANTLVIKESVNHNQDENVQFNLLANEFRYYEKTMVISSIIKITKDLNMTMHYIKAYENKVDFIVRTKKQNDIPTYVKKLFNSKYFLDVKNTSSSKLKDDRVQITMTATVKER